MKTRRCSAFCRKEHRFTYADCLQSYCNPACDGYNFAGNKRQRQNFLKKIKRGFHKTYLKTRMAELKKKGALSGCAVERDSDE